ncbi:hypothetical protein [Gluconobacter frateurii]|uniref:Uncharacterized protein n=1 Tax=Gluconobacter frateurii NRIC 0228 TaxID=1307946 RepID=A0ABQ0QFW5_9PROT|nr:hypothetical protein [Gluconobacter frateurii]GBR17461.1 hypothetical protein AA0228_3033 [Gluconobacter frateurii NRIC 0228]GLP89611.1 hypothetical protein GCM10007868_06860 [Gluconobacter frateurii]
MKKLFLLGILLSSNAFADENNTSHGAWKTTNIIIDGKTIMCTISTKSGDAGLDIMFPAVGGEPKISFNLDNKDIGPEKPRTAYLKYGSSERKITFDNEKNYEKANFTSFESSYDVPNLTNLLEDISKEKSFEISAPFIKNKGWVYTTNSYKFDMNGFDESTADLTRCLKNIQ